jgi:hypothetical protein
VSKKFGRRCKNPNNGDACPGFLQAFWVVFTSQLLRLLFQPAITITKKCNDDGGQSTRHNLPTTHNLTTQHPTTHNLTTHNIPTQHLTTQYLTTQYPTTQYPTTLQRFSAQHTVT